VSSRPITITGPRWERGMGNVLSTNFLALERCCERMDHSRQIGVLYDKIAPVSIDSA
jgi:hypothetical protein